MVTRFSCLISAGGIKTFMLGGVVIFSTKFAPSLVWCWASGCGDGHTASMQCMLKDGALSRTIGLPFVLFLKTREKKQDN
jgi:hypothetical protein